MKKISILLLISFNFFIAQSQSVGIGTTVPNASSQLDITSAGKGLLIPRMTTSGVTFISNPAKGLMVYDSVKNQLMVNMGTPAVPNWQTIVAGSGWTLSGNNGINPGTQFIGTTNNQPLRFRTNNIWTGEINPATGNIFLGLNAGQANTTGYSNVAFGSGALKLNTDRANLVAIGDSALYNNGSSPLIYTNEGLFNVAVGSKTLYSNTTGYYNTAIGNNSLYSNTTGVYNTALGPYALYLNTTGFSNTALGPKALYSNTEGDHNIASGDAALYSNTTGYYNIASGYLALYLNTTGYGNTAIGALALRNTTASAYNTALGYNAGRNFDNGYNNVFLGANVDVNGPGYYNVIAIGQGTICTASSQVTIGNGATNSYRAYANWSNISDGRFKKNVQENVPGLDFITKLRPVTYSLDATGLDMFLHKNDKSAGKLNDVAKSINNKALQEKEAITYTGFVAQDVEATAKQLGFNFSGIDAPKDNNDFYGLRYAEFVVPLVKGMQEQQTIIADLQKQIDDLKTLIKNIKQ